MPPKREKVLIAKERAEKELRKAESEIRKLEQRGYDLKMEQLAKSKEAATKGEDIDAVITDYERKISRNKAELDKLKVKRNAYRETIDEHEKEFQALEIKRMKLEFEKLPAEHLKAIKERDTLERELEQAQRRVDGVAGRKMMLNEKIYRMEKEYKAKYVAEEVPTAEEKEKIREESEYNHRCIHVFQQIDDETLVLLRNVSDPEVRIQKLRQLRFAHNEMLNTVIFNRPLTRPSHRPDPFPDMTLEQIARVPYDDAVKARFAQDDELRKKILDEYRK